jgi:hypothetical protein
VADADRPSDAGRAQADAVLVALLASGCTQLDAAEQAGVSPRTVRRRLDDPGFRAELDEARTEMVRRTVGKLVDAGTTAASNLRELAEGAESESVRLHASRYLIELALRGHEAMQLTQRLATLEAQVAALKQNEGQGRWAA